MKEDCNLSIKVVTRHPVARNSNKTLEARAKFVEEWPAKGMDFMTNCVFLDESGFDINMRRSRDWDPGNVKRRKVVGATKRKVPGDAASVIPKVTTAGHYLQFISDTLDIMDEFPNMKGFHIVMDNAPIHSHSLVDL
ncbi:hypothetical protein INT47_005353 [Mucor saturninus]|uniref:Tc1-like transposase DDE domain-containing protein n=1 Tax=Mucor saturninus TaxID=64648 RepID=A0A8H7QI03_9FUNG|nr:hypothetical protein INT47_005353 [Mucor saturninus]